MLGYKYSYELQAYIDYRQGLRPDLNHQDLLELLIQEAWQNATRDGVALSDILLEVRACRTDCGSRNCGVMDDFCGGKIACGGVVCGEFEICSSFGKCEDDIEIDIKRLDTHEIVHGYDSMEPISSTSSLLVFEPTDDLYRGRYHFECKHVSSENPDTTSYPEPVTVTVGNASLTILPTLPVCTLCFILTIFHAQQLLW